MRTKRLFNEIEGLEYGRLLFRNIKNEDAKDLFKLFSNEKIYKYRPGVARKTDDAVCKLIQTYQTEFENKESVCWIVCLAEETHTVVGTAEVFGIDSRIEKVDIGYSICEEYWGKGIATEVVQFLTKYLFEQIEANRIQAHVMPENIPSNKVLQKNDYVLEGLIRQGAFWNGKGIVDLNKYAFLREDYLAKKEIQ